jgi:hypothetical protein
MSALEAAYNRRNRDLAAVFGWDRQGDPILWMAAKIESTQGQVDELRDALEHLLDEQNGPPLAKYAADWHKAMMVANRVLGRTEGAELHEQKLEELTCDGKTTTPNMTTGHPTPATLPSTSTE